MAISIKFIGAAGMVTGSSYLVTTSTQKFLVDCGLFQGGYEADRKNYQPFSYDPKTIDFMILTHSHLDHCGLTPKLVKNGFKGKIYSTPATRELTETLLTDAAHIQEHGATDRNIETLFMQKDVLKTLRQFETYNYNRTFTIGDIKIRLQDAGHILGAAIVEIWADGKKIVFSGDLGNSPVPIMKDPTLIAEADYVVCESTYGNRFHEPPANREKKLLAAIRHAHKRNAKLIIPSFALERSQDLLYTLNLFRNTNQMPHIPVILDSPLAIKVTAIYKKYTKLFDETFQKYLKVDKDLFSFPDFQQANTTAESKSINDLKGTAIIIAGSGMADGGRVQHHLIHHLGETDAQVVFVGFCTSGTLGRKLIEGAARVRIKDMNIAVKATIRTINAYSAHADQNGLMGWLAGFTNHPTVILTHGEDEARQILSNKIARQLKWKVILPKLGQVVSL
ncbi:MAG: MBL fold metallo-hydrolase [Patescibacteria group bacterium]